VNCGRRLAKKTAIFGFPRLLTTPWRRARAGATLADARNLTGRVRRPPPEGRVHGLSAEVDEIRGAGELQRAERGLGRSQERDDPGAHGERPDRLAERDTGGGRDPAPASARERAPDRECRVLSGRADDDRRDREKGGEALEHVGSIACVARVARSRESTAEAREYDRSVTRLPRGRRSRRREACVLVLACLGALVSSQVGGSAGSAGKSFNAGIVWVDTEADSFEGIYSADVDGTGIRRLVPTIADSLSGPAWSPNGDALVFSARNSDDVQLHVLRPAAGRLRMLRIKARWTYPRGRNVSLLFEPAWSPDGRHLAVSDAWSLSHATIRVVDLWAGRVRRPLTVPSRRTDDTSPAWSPDGRTIAFVRRQVTPDEDHGPAAIFLMGHDGRGLHRLTRGTSPSWSPDGRHVVFALGTRIYRIRADGSGRTLITKGPRLLFQPRWSPDGRKILYVTAGHRGIWIMNVDGSDQARVILRPRHVRDAGWRPG
jgi:WD40-like Beta Propeller Repeat